MLQMFVLALSLYNTWNRGVFLLCKITNLLIYSCENYDIIAINLSAKWDGVMKRKVIVSITFVVLLCSIVLCVINQKKAPFIEGVIVEKNERFFTIETDIQEKIVCTLPKEYDYQDISLGDNIRVYYKGEILETSPARIKNVKEIKKI